MECFQETEEQKLEKSEINFGTSQEKFQIKNVNKEYSV